MPGKTSQRFPLLPACAFMEACGLGNEAEAIRRSEGQLASYNATIRRGRVIEALERHDLLDDFINSEWPVGLTEQGRRQIDHCVSVYQRFLAENPASEHSPGGDGGDAPKAREKTERDPFEVLGIAGDAETEVIAAAYRALARKYHPDVNRSLSSDEALNRMREVNWAREELERDLNGWKNRARNLRPETAASYAEDPTRKDATTSQEFDVQMTLTEWLAGGGERILIRAAQGGIGSFAIAKIAASGNSYVQFSEAWKDNRLEVEAVSNYYVPTGEKLSEASIQALQALGFSIKEEDGNFVLNRLATASSGAKIAGTALRDVYGATPESLLDVHVNLEEPG